MRRKRWVGIGLAVLALTAVSLEAASSAVTVTSQTNLNTGSIVVTNLTASALVKTDASKKLVTATDGTDYISPTVTATLTNKRITPRIHTLTDAATVTPDSDSYDGGLLATLSQATQIANPTGTPVNFQKYTLRIKSTTARALTYGAQFRGSADLALPAATSGASLTDYLVFQWNSADSKWDCVGRNFGF